MIRQRPCNYNEGELARLYESFKADNSYMASCLRRVIVDLQEERRLTASLLEGIEKAAQQQ